MSAPKIQSRSKSLREHLPRREFLKLSAAGSIAGLLATDANAQSASSTQSQASRGPSASYAEHHLDRIAFPLGGLGAGMVCVEGTGALSHLSVRNQPDVFNEPCFFAALAIKSPLELARVLEGPVPQWKLFGGKGDGEGAVGSTYGLPRCARARFTPRFPFCTIDLEDDALPLTVQLVAWSPFTPGDADSSSLPVAALEYRFTNRSSQLVEAVFSCNAKNFMEVERSQKRRVQTLPGGFSIHGAGPDDRPWETGSFAVTTDSADARVNAAWFRGGWWDAFTMAWNDVASGSIVSRPAIVDGEPSPGASLFVPLRFEPGESKTVVVRLSWFVPDTNFRLGPDPAGVQSEPSATHRPWYASRFDSIEAVTAHWEQRYEELRRRSDEFSRCFYDSTLPQAAIEAVAANLSILKSPTILRQPNGSLWAWEGCGDIEGRGEGTCTHVWNYAQAIAHLFPALERTLRETEFGAAQDASGHQMFRVTLPIRPMRHITLAAADGQLGGIMKVYRDWRISGDTAWLKTLWPRIRDSLDYCISIWDPERRGWLSEPHHNTYDIELWGPNGMCTSVYTGALSAAVQMGRALQANVTSYNDLMRRGRTRLERDLFDGEYFVQRVEWRNRGHTDPLMDRKFQVGYSPEAIEVSNKEGPKYQYAGGCLSDGIIGAWFAEVCGVGEIVDAKKVASHLRAVHRHNLKRDLSVHANPQRPGYAAGHEGGLLLCTWPKGGKPLLPFVYSNEVWTGIEYQVASHLIMTGAIVEGLEIVSTCRARYDGRVRNPFDEYEYGHWYGRALASYALLQALSGASYDAVDKVLHLKPTVKGDFRSFLSTASGFGTVGVRQGKPFFEVASGQVDVARINYVAKT
ncbi:MAG TPA: GH116 family glycosyl hydrolase [Steroidobacteraceae bacterium]|nr:GH116 family glycosyl hydrolase [Steroidobacteraceae bacterium]